MVDRSELDMQVVLERLRAKLGEIGVTDEVLAAAVAEGADGIARMVARYLMFPGERRYTPLEVYTKSGVDEDTAVALWRAMGFPQVPDDEPAFTDADVEALREACRLFDRAEMDRDIVLQQARTMSQAVARIAESHQDVIADIVPAADPVGAADRALSLAEETLPVLDHVLVYMYRRHLAAATERRMLVSLTAEGGVRMSVGFADMTGFTRLSGELDVRELARLVDRFNAASSDTVTNGGGRVVKTIGDEVMFSAHEVGAAASIAADLLENVSEADGLPPLRVGLACGLVISREGDVFGAPVNLASRLVALARPDSALVDQETYDALEGDERFVFSSLGRQQLKGFGTVRVFRLRPAGLSAGGARDGRR
jgi:adenylate cyclase